MPDFQFYEAASIVGDLNGDGYSDFVRSQNNTLSDYFVYLNDKNQGFTDVSATWSVPTEIDFSYNDAKFVDLNGDSILDIAYQHNCNTSCETYFWEGDGITGWTDVTNDYALPVTTDIADYIFVDLNSDNLVDIFMLRELWSGNWQKEVFLNQSDGTWVDVSGKLDDSRNSLQYFKRR